MINKERFRVTGKITKLLGRESVSDPVIALFEIIKNSHDADALLASVKFDFLSAEKKIIIKETEGDGMKYDDIKNKFLVIGTYSKDPGDGKQRTTKRHKRLILGQKGVGRFALEKLGRKVKIISKPIGTYDKLTFSIDWDRFEPEEVTVDMIPIKIQKEKRDDKLDSGLEIEISGLRDEWDSDKIKQLIQFLKSFILPKQLQPQNSFNIELEAPSLGIERRVIESELSETAFFYLESILEKNKIIFSAEKMGKSYIRKQELENFRSHFTGDIRDVSDLTCGPVKLYVYYFPEFSKHEKYPMLEDLYYKSARDYYGQDIHDQIKDLMKDNHGVKIYRGGLREFKYGDPGDDWVDRAKISRDLAGTMQVNRIIGFCILRNNPQIVATTNRREAVQNQAFLDLRDFVVASMKKLDQKISEDRDDAYQKAKGLEEQKIKEEIEKAKKSPSGEYGTEKVLRTALSKAEEHIDRMQKLDDSQITIKELELAHTTLGHFISRIYHDFVGSSIELIGTDINQLDEHAKGIHPKTQRQLEDIVNELERKWDQIKIIFNAVDNMEKGLGVEEYYKREKSNIQVSHEIETIFEELKIISQFYDVDLQNKIKPNLEIWTHSNVFYSLVYNLLTNSFKALMRSKPKDRKNIIKIESELTPKFLIIRFSDNSTVPIPKNKWDTVFEPWISTTYDLKIFRGRGIGLSICKSIIKFVRGEIEIVDPVLDGGTTVEIRLPRGSVNSK